MLIDLFQTLKNCSTQFISLDCYWWVSLSPLFFEIFYCIHVLRPHLLMCVFLSSPKLALLYSQCVPYTSCRCAPQFSRFPKSSWALSMLEMGLVTYRVPLVPFALVGGYDEWCKIAVYAQESRDPKVWTSLSYLFLIVLYCSPARNCLFIPSQWKSSQNQPDRTTDIKL